MTSIFEIDKNNDRWRMLPGGVYILFQHHYTPPEFRGVLAVSIASIISVIAIISLLIAIVISIIRNWRLPETDKRRDKRHQFIRSHAGIYFICMLLSTLTFTLGFSLSLYWAIRGRITFGTFCTIQAALKQFGNVATALWVLAIAIHTFVIVFLQLRVAKWVGWTGFAIVWILSAAVVIAGPLIYTTKEMGPWYGISAQWCWTSDTYVMPRFITEYLWMFLSAGASFVLYTLLFLKLRGHIGSDLRFSFRARPLGADMSRVAHQMLWYPMVYAVLVFPIAGCRIYEIKTFMMSNLEVKMGSAVFFMLFGLINVILYTLTRNIIPLPSFIRKLLGISSPMEPNSPSPRDSEKAGFRRMSNRYDEEDGGRKSAYDSNQMRQGGGYLVPSNASSPSMPAFSKVAPPSPLRPLQLPKRNDSRRVDADISVPAMALMREGRNDAGRGMDEEDGLWRMNSVESSSSLGSTRSSPLSISEKMAMAVEYTTPVVPERSYRPTSPSGSTKAAPGDGSSGGGGADAGLKKSSSVLSGRSANSFGSSRSTSPTNSRGVNKNGRAVLQKPNPAMLSPFDG
ncbi:hypothetical protein FRC15_004810 [Serendipita sp. 397]|nr:hypothetical protein FRC15_004810 [Serendipita sp. 397]